MPPEAARARRESRERPLRILLSNDDGYQARGLRTLAEHLKPIAEVVVVAPDRNRSGASNSLTLETPLRVERVDENLYYVNGTPTDCVHIAITGLLEHEPDVLISGINNGANLGDDVLYSGTVAAAMEGLALGIPSIAISFAGGDLRADVSRLDEQVAVLVPLLRHLTSLTPFPADTLLNINLPPVPPADQRGVRLTRLGRRVYSNSIQPMKDPWGRAIYWIGGGEISWQGADDSDFQAIRDACVSVTPLHLDLTNRDMLDTRENWWQAP